MIETIEYKGTKYPAFQAEFFSAQYAFPFAKKLCKGEGYDIGCGKMDWCFPGAIPIDPALNDYHALYLPVKNVDYIFSSHCLEHIPDWIQTLNYWTDNLKVGGVLFLYLPHPDQKYWSSWSDTKHIHIFHPEDILGYFEAKNYTNIFASGRDLNHSFIAVGEKC